MYQYQNRHLFDLIFGKLQLWKIRVKTVCVGGEEQRIGHIYKITSVWFVQDQKFKAVKRYTK